MPLDAPVPPVKEGSSRPLSSVVLSLLVSVFSEKKTLKAPTHTNSNIHAYTLLKKVQNRKTDFMLSYHHLHVCEAGAQLPPPVSLPAQITVPPPWSALSLSQADLGVIFSNSSPFSFSQSLLLVPPLGANSKAGVRASFGPYSVTQVGITDKSLCTYGWMSVFWIT